MTENQEKARGVMNALYALEAAATPKQPTLDANELLEAVKLAYRKHHLGDDTIGWDELSEELMNVLCEAMGDKAFQAWSKPYGSQEDTIRD